MEKSNRFAKEKLSRGPGETFQPSLAYPIINEHLGPGAYNNEPQKKTGKTALDPSQNIIDRYAVLQRKVEDLEKIHNEDKMTACLSFSSLTLSF